MDALYNGTDTSTLVNDENFPAKPLYRGRVCQMGEHQGPYGALIQSSLGQAGSEAKGRLQVDQLGQIPGRWGVLLASTKGSLEDHIWQHSGSGSEVPDYFTPILDHFILSEGLNPEISLSISNACSSSHGALALGSAWLAQDRVDHVAILAADAPGPFVVAGFSALHALAVEPVCPFDRERHGMQVGDAAAVIILSRQPSRDSHELLGGAIASDGSLATKPLLAGETLSRLSRSLTEGVPDLVIAHGTGTKAGDASEDAAYEAAFGVEVPVTGTKWSIGHSLGASGAIDVIAGLEVLKTQKIFAIGNSREVDPTFKCRYLLGAAAHDPCLKLIRTILVGSMGFGGTNGAVLLGLGSQ
jgi:hypothetical protein